MGIIQLNLGLAYRTYWGLCLDSVCQMHQSRHNLAAAQDVDPATEEDSRALAVSEKCHQGATNQAHGSSRPQ